MARFVSIARSVVVTIEVQVINFVCAIGVDCFQSQSASADASGRTFVNVIQAVRIRVDERSCSAETTRRDVIGRRLSFHVIRDAIVVAVEVQVVQYSVAV